MRIGEPENIPSRNVRVGVKSELIAPWSEINYYERQAALVVISCWVKPAVPGRHENSIFPDQKDS